MKVLLVLEMLVIITNRTYSDRKPASFTFLIVCVCFVYLFLGLQPLWLGLFIGNIIYMAFRTVVCILFERVCASTERY